MCILFAHSGGPSAGGYKLILASNRDEYFKRPADIAAPWKEDNSVIGGRDMEKGREGGTWLAASPNRRRVAALLNLPGVPGPENPRGRGSVVSDFVLGNATTEEYVTYFKEFGHEFSPFNLVTVHILENSSKIHFYSNFDSQLRDYNGAVSFSNSQADRPLQKTVAGLEEFKDIVAKNSTDPKLKDSLVQELLNLLKSEKRHLPDPELEKRKPKAPDALASIFVRIPDANYGTRTHTIILVDKDDNFDFWEWTMLPEQKDWKVTHLQQKI